MDVFDRLADYFQGIADSLAGDKAASSVFPNKGDAGSSREDLLFEFLRAHVPKRCEVIRGGFIFDCEGNESGQIDLIITNDLTLQFKQFDHKSFNCIEGCFAAISVKTTLDGNAIRDSVENLASVPTMPPLNLNPLLKNSPTMLQNLPLRTIFAFGGVSPETAHGHLEDLTRDGDVPPHALPKLVIVNNEYNIIRTGPEGGKTRGGELIPPNRYVVVQAGSYAFGGFSLMYLVSEIQKASNIGSQMFMDFNRYVDRFPLE